MVVHEENDFERRARSGGAEFERRAAYKPGHRFLQSWWWFALISAQFWVRVLVWPFQDHHTRGDNVLALLALIFMMTFTPAFIWAKRKARNKRLELTETDAADHHPSAHER